VSERGEIEAFLGSAVETFEELEVLMLLHEHRQREWTADEIAAKVGLCGIAIGQACVALRDTGLLRGRIETGAHAFCYRPRDPTQDHAVAEIARLYTVDRLSIVKLLNANAIERIRTAAMRMFADAFLIRKGRKGG
jgi:hypothetical protein